MPRNAAKPPRGGGHRISAAQAEKRLDAVEELLAAGRPRRAVVAECERRFKMAERTCDDYIRKTRERWSAERAEAQPSEREAAISRLQRLARKLEKRQQWGALVSVERLLVDIFGLRLSHVDLHAQVDAQVVQGAEPEITEERAAEILERAARSARFRRAGVLQAAIAKSPDGEARATLERLAAEVAAADAADHALNTRVDEALANTTAQNTRVDGAPFPTKWS
jgi:hypothetical protein